MKKINKKATDRGVTLFIAIVITGTLLLVSTGIVTVAVRQSFLTSAGKQSQYAFYVADTGAECAIYWDVKNPAGYSAFSTSTTSTIDCNKNTSNPGNSFVVGGASPSKFRITFLPQSYCADVTVTKTMTGTTTRTTIQSQGRSTCSDTDPRRVERAVEVNY